MDSSTSAADGERPARVSQLVAAAAARTPDHPAIIDVTSGDTLSWAQLDAAVTAEAHRLSAADVTPGDRVVVRLVDGAGFCVAVLGALRAGLIAVPYGPVAVSRELDIVFADCRPAVVVAAPSDRAAADAAATVGATVLGPPALDAAVPTGTPERAADGAGDAEDIALLVYTSGTTGTPRGVALSHRAVLANRAQVSALRPAPVTSVDRVLLTLPLYHVFGLAAGFLQVCWAGATAVIPGPADAATLADLVVEHRVSALAGVPSVYRALLSLPTARLQAVTAGIRVAMSGGAPLPAELLADFNAAAGLWIVEGYGLTEAGPVVTSNAFDRPPKPGSVGRVLPGVELRIVDADGRPLGEEESNAPAEEGAADGESAADDEAWDDEWDEEEDAADDTGMVAVRGPNLFSGYWPDLAGGPDAEGWFRTADVGFLDADGDLRLVDRSSDVVIVSGFNVFPREVEQVLAELDGVAEAAVVGVPSDRTGEAVKAVVVRVPDAGLDEEAVRKHCAARLARFKIPAEIEFVDVLPRTPTGKIARRQLAGSAE